MVFKDIFPDYTEFKTWIDTILDVYTKNNNQLAEWLDESIMFSSYKMLFYHLNNFYKNRSIRYKLDDWFGYFENVFVNASFDLFMKQQPFYNKELKTIRSYRERDSANVTTTSGGDTTDSSTTANAFSGTNEPLTPTDNIANKSQTILKLNSQNSTENYNIIENLKMLMNYTYRIGIDSYIERFNHLFRMYIGTQIKMKFTL